MTTKVQKMHFARVAALGCAVCGAESEIHHICTGMGRKKNDDLVIPLCPDHHRNGGYGVAIHAGKKTFENKYGTERELYNQVMEALNK